tara:strand:- start:79 stop:315 length:237 start_codon:yes stop_codon:yes gene_type:complete
MLLKRIKSYMGLKANSIKTQGVSTDKVDTPLTYDIKLTEKELELLLLTIKNGLFKGEYVETLYTLTLKIQETYIKIKK